MSSFAVATGDRAPSWSAQQKLLLSRHNITTGASSGSVAQYASMEGRMVETDAVQREPTAFGDGGVCDHSQCGPHLCKSLGVVATEAPT